MNQMARHIVLGVHITDRIQQVTEVQQVLTAYGDIIRTRVGLHHDARDGCSPNGLLLLDLLDLPERVDELIARLGAIEGVEVQHMFFDHF